MLSDSFPVAPIAALRGGPGSGATDVLAQFALHRKAEGVAVVGVIAPPVAGAHADAGRKSCECQGVLLDLATGETIGIHQDLGPGSEACSLDTSALARACGAVERAIAAGGADLVVLNRFGLQEAERRGLMAAFHAAAAAGLPIACMVAPKVESVWEDFAAGLSEWLPGDAEALEAWWRRHVVARRRAA